MTVREPRSIAKVGNGFFPDRKQFGLTEDGRREIGRLGRQIDILAKETVFKEGEPKSAVYMLTRGTAIRYRTRADGRKQIVGFALPGDFLNSPFADRYTCSVDVIDQARACHFPRRRLLTVLDANPKTLRELLEISWREIDATYEHMLLLGRGTAKEKFVEFIISWRARVARKGALANLVPLPMSRRDIADYLGLTIETISRLLTELEREDVVRVVPEGLQLIGTTEKPLLLERSCKALQQMARHSSKAVSIHH